MFVAVLLLAFGWFRCRACGLPLFGVAFRSGSVVPGLPNVWVSLRLCALPVLPAVVGVGSVCPVVGCAALLPLPWL